MVVVAPFLTMTGMMMLATLRNNDEDDGDDDDNDNHDEDNRDVTIRIARGYSRYRCSTTAKQQQLNTGSNK